MVSVSAGVWFSTAAKEVTAQGSVPLGRVTAILVPVALAVL